MHLVDDEHITLTINKTSFFYREHHLFLYRGSISDTYFSHCHMAVEKTHIFSNEINADLFQYLLHLNTYCGHVKPFLSST